MEIKLPPRELALYRAIDEILWTDWDPIGIHPWGPRDEYHAYLPKVFQLALAGNVDNIADYLFSVATEQMGLTTERNRHLAIAEKVLNARSTSHAS